MLSKVANAKSCPWERAWSDATFGPFFRHFPVLRVPRLSDLSLFSELLWIFQNSFRKKAFSYLFHSKVEFSFMKKAYILLTLWQTTVSWFSKITWAAEQSINTLRTLHVLLCPWLFEHQLTAAKTMKVGQNRLYERGSW